MEKLVIATRGSRLALWQANHVKDSLEAVHPGLAVELNIIKTKGDIILDVPLAKVGGKGLFVKEIEEALLSGAADIAVHSMKDVPMELPEGLILGIVPEREDPTDLFLSVDYDSLENLPAGAVVGTSSLRRQAQVLAQRPDLEVVSLRGNVDTRLRKLTEGQFAAIIMATAGMKRLGLSVPKECPLAPPAFIPAVGQGALGIEFREDRKDLAEMLSFMEHRPTRICVEAERGLLAGLWELPNTPGLLDERQAGEYASGQGLGDVRLRSARDGRHIFTHIVWTMRCYTLECSAMPPRYHWATPDELREEISLPTAFRQFVDAE